MSLIKVGEKAPDFGLLDQDGKEVKLSQYRGANVILFFFVHTFSPV
jgi:peroxiredoxin Q/BCP